MGSSCHGHFSAGGADRVKRGALGAWGSERSERQVTGARGVARR